MGKRGEEVQGERSHKVQKGRKGGVKREEGRRNMDVRAEREETKSKRREGKIMWEGKQEKRTSRSKRTDNNVTGNGNGVL